MIFTDLLFDALGIRVLSKLTENDPALVYPIAHPVRTPTPCNASDP